MRIVVTKEVRTLLAELDALFRRFDEKTQALSYASTSDTDAINIGAEREQVKAEIIGMAYRIRNAAFGFNEWAELGSRIHDGRTAEDDRLDDPRHGQAERINKRGWY